MPLTNEQVLFSLHRYFGEKGGLDPTAAPVALAPKKEDPELSEFTKDLIKDFNNLGRLEDYFAAILEAEKTKREKEKPKAATPTSATPVKARPKPRKAKTMASRKTSIPSTPLSPALGMSEAKLFAERFDKTMSEKERVRTILSNHYEYKPARNKDPQMVDYKKSQELLKHIYLLYISAILKAQKDLNDLPGDSSDDTKNKMLSIAMDIWRADKLLKIYVRWFQNVYIKHPINDDVPDDASSTGTGGIDLDAFDRENKKELLNAIGYKIQNPPSEDWKSPAIAVLATGVATLFGISTHQSFFPGEDTPADGANEEALPPYDAPPAYEDTAPVSDTSPGYESAPLPVDDVSADVADDDQLNPLYWSAIVASSVTNAANYAASLVQVLTYLHNIQEVLHFWRDGELFNSNHKPIPISAEQKIQYCLQILFYGIGWTTVLASAFFAAFGPIGLVMLPFIALSMVLASKFVIDAHLYNLSEKSWDIFQETIKGLFGQYDDPNDNTLKNWFANLAQLFLGFIPAAVIAPMMGYAFFGKFLSAFNSFIPELGIDLIALGTGATTMGPLLLTILPLVLAIYVFHSKLPNWIRYPLTILLALTAFVGIGLAISTIGWPIILIALAAIMGTFVSIVVFKMLVNAAIRWCEIYKKFHKEVFMPVYEDSKFAAYCLIALFFTPLLGLVLLNALANAALSTAGLEGFLPMLDAFAANEVSGTFLLATMMGFSLILGLRSTMDLLNRYIAPMYTDIKNSKLVNEMHVHSALARYSFGLTILPVLSSVMIPFIALYGVAKAIIFLAPVLIEVAKDLFILSLSGLSKNTSASAAATAAGTPPSRSRSSSSAAASTIPGAAPEFKPPQEIHGITARSLAILAGLVVGTVGVAVYAAYIPAYMVVKGFSAAFNAAFGEPAPAAAPVAPAAKTEAPSPSEILDTVLASTFRKVAPRAPTPVHSASTIAAAPAPFVPAASTMTLT